MKFIEFDHHKCDECYKCLRVCPTKAIKFTEHNRDIINSLCIKCGLCQASCPQSALTIQNDRHKIKKQIHLGRKIAVSLAPSFAAAFEDQDPKKIITALRTLGVTWVEETGVAAELVSRNYEAMLETMGTENVLTTCCPSANYLVQQYYPELLDAMLPVVSPMIAHGKLLKEKHGPDCYTVFIGPCLAKKAEAEEMPYIDAVLTFNELAGWLEDEGIPYRQLPPGVFDEKATIRGMAYPMGGSLFKNDRQTPIHSGYRMIRADGIDRCKDLLETLRIGGIKNYCIEMNICSGSCINGPDMPHDGLKFFQRKDRMLDYLKAHADHRELDQLLCESSADLSFKHDFEAHVVQLKKPTKEEVNEILRKIDKFSEKDHLNCGACGYETCVSKAIAVYNEMSKPQMCLPYLRSKAESLSMALFENTPNLVCVLDHQLNILEYNPTFAKTFDMEKHSLKEVPVVAFLDGAFFSECVKQEKSIFGQRVHLETIGKVLYCNAIYTERFILGIMTDMTAVEKSRQELAAVKEKTLVACQEVINKQMRVAQEIASLLGETTAETKVNLNRLKEIVMMDEGY